MKDFTIECIAMLAIYAIVIVDFMRRHQKKYALLSLPLVALPMFYLMGLAIGNFIINNLLHYNPYWFMLCAILVGIAVSGILISLVSRVINSKKLNFYYNVFCFLYTLIIGIILAISIMHRFINFNFI